MGLEVYSSIGVLQVKIDYAPSALSQHLELARSRLEERFLEGGSVLVTALDSIGSMVVLLDSVIATLGEDTVNSTVSNIDATNRKLRALPETHATEQTKINDLATLVFSLEQPVENMLETLRYLCALAVSVKITGAGAPEFASFADEMMDKIQSGRHRADAFSDRLKKLTRQVRAACVTGTVLQCHYQETIPDVARDLTTDSQRMTAYFNEVLELASELTTLVRAAQMKVASVLSALQIGDMTRQRIEHVQSGLALLEAERGERAQPVVLRLLCAQMDDLLREFRDGCITITSSLTGIAGDAQQVMALGQQASGNSKGAPFLSALENSLSVARIIVTDIEKSGENAEALRDEIASTAGELSAAVGHIRDIRNEIQFMTINTSLRCSRMGDAGKPMNVIATELRVFAEQMEYVSGLMVERLSDLSETARRLSTETERDGDRDIANTLDSALSVVSKAGDRVNEALKTLTSSGNQVARDISHGTARLDFAHELGEVLDECHRSLEEQAADAEANIADASLADADAIINQIFASYTMAREREIHRTHLGVADSEPPVVSAAEQDDFDCLF